VYVPLEFPTSNCPNVGEDEIPVPPNAVESVDDAVTVPLVDCKRPVRLAIERLEVKRRDEEAVVVKSDVVVACVPVAFKNVKFCRVEEPVVRRFANEARPEETSVENDALLVTARLVVVAFVVVEFPVMTRLPFTVDDAAMRPLLKVSVVLVALLGNGSWSVVPVASVPQERTPAGDALTSQDALFKLETMRPVVEARPKTERFVVVAFVVVVLVKMLFPVQVLLA
jgi:hypothetical protein